jgi:hypothetical protein
VCTNRRIAGAANAAPPPAAIAAIAAMAAIAANRRQPPSTAANRRQPPPTAANRRQLPPTAANRRRSAAVAGSGTLGKPPGRVCVYRDSAAPATLAPAHAGCTGPWRFRAYLVP